MPGMMIQLNKNIKESDEETEGTEDSEDQPKEETEVKEESEEDQEEYKTAETSENIQNQVLEEIPEENFNANAQIAEEQLTISSEDLTNQIKPQTGFKKTSTKLNLYDKSAKTENVKSRLRATTKVDYKETRSYNKQKDKESN